MTDEVAIVGAGLCGLSCANALHAAGVSVTLLDKARKAGGRMSTRRGPASTFDHGAQYFTVRNEAFAEQVDAWGEAGVAAPWAGRIAVATAGTLTPKHDGQWRWVGTPTMSAIPRHLAAGLTVNARCRVAAVEREGERWQLRDDQGAVLGTWPTVLVTTPAAQAVPLLAAAPALAEQVRAVSMDPCWAVMVALREPWGVDADGVFVHESPVAWAARDRSKPGRSGPDAWVLHATVEWTREHWDDPPEAVAQALVGALATAAGMPPPAVEHTDVQRWRYARADAPLPSRALWDPQLRLGVGGDWCGGPRVEGAWLSGRALAQHVLGA